MVETGLSELKMEGGGWASVLHKDDNLLQGKLRWGTGEGWMDGGGRGGEEVIQERMGMQQAAELMDVFMDGWMRGRGGVKRKIKSLKGW